MCIKILNNDVLFLILEKLCPIDYISCILSSGLWYDTKTNVQYQKKKIQYIWEKAKELDQYIHFKWIVGYSIVGRKYDKYK